MVWAVEAYRANNQLPGNPDTQGYVFGYGGDGTVAVAAACRRAALANGAPWPPPAPPPLPTPPPPSNATVAPGTWMQAEEAVLNGVGTAGSLAGWGGDMLTAARWT